MVVGGQVHDVHVLVDAGVVHDEDDGPQLMARLGSQVLERLVEEVVEHRSVDTTLDQQVGQDTILADG